MTKLADASINTFGNSPKADVPPSEDPIFVLTSSQLRQIVAEALQPLQDEVSQLQVDRDKDREEMATLRSKLASLETLQEQDTTRNCLDIAYDRRRLAALEHPTKEPGKTETSRAEKIEKYLASRPDHKATFETLKGMLQVDNIRLNEAIKVLIATSDRSYVIQKEKTGDKRKRSLIMLPK